VNKDANYACILSALHNTSNTSKTASKQGSLTIKPEGNSFETCYENLDAAIRCCNITEHFIPLENTIISLTLYSKDSESKNVMGKTLIGGTTVDEVINCIKAYLLQIKQFTDLASGFSLSLNSNKSNNLSTPFSIHRTVFEDDYGQPSVPILGNNYEECLKYLTNLIDKGALQQWLDNKDIPFFLFRIVVKDRSNKVVNVPLFRVFGSSYKDKKIKMINSIESKLAKHPLSYDASQMELQLYFPGNEEFAQASMFANSSLSRPLYLRLRSEDMEKEFGKVLNKKKLNTWLKNTLPDLLYAVLVYCSDSGEMVQLDHTIDPPEGLETRKEALEYMIDYVKSTNIKLNNDNGSYFLCLCNLGSKGEFNHVYNEDLMELEKEMFVKFGNHEDSEKVEDLIDFFIPTSQAQFVVLTKGEIEKQMKIHR
jgi:hypothetical protein